ncbi:MAG: Trm112 family protein [Candidatus Aenigmatarchaeota archaeon]
MAVPKELLLVLACPKCKGKIKYERKENRIVCARCRLMYPVLEGDIPDMLIDDAEKF